MQSRGSVVGLMALALLALVPASALADDGDDGPDRPITVGLLAGYGLDLSGADLNPYGIGFGVRGGYSLDALYLGARFMFFLGESEDVTIAGETIEMSSNLMTIGAEVGYDLELSDRGITLRPEIGLGLALSSGEGADTAGNMVDTSSTDFYVAPGASLLFCLGTNVFTGLNVQVPIVFAEELGTGLTLLGILGLRF